MIALHLKPGQVIPLNFDDGSYSETTLVKINHDENLIYGSNGIKLCRTHERRSRLCSSF